MSNNLKKIEATPAFTFCAAHSHAVRSPHAGNSSLRRSLPLDRHLRTLLPAMPAVGWQGTHPAPVVINSVPSANDAFGSLPTDAIQMSCAVLVDPSSDRHSQLIITDALVSAAWLDGLFRVLRAADLTHFPFLRQRGEVHGAPDGSAAVAFAIMVTSTSGDREAHVIFGGDGDPENWLLELESLLYQESQYRFGATCKLMEAAGVDLHDLFAREEAQLEANDHHAEVS